MRHQFTPVFREFTTSSMWAESCETRCVWLWLLLNADPEGFVPGTVPGLAIAANVPLEATRSAVDKFMAPDPDSNTQAHEGRRLERVPHGWRILNFTYWRELAKHEADKARKRRWAEQHRKGKQLSLPFPPEFLPADEPESTAVDASSETLDAPKPIPIPNDLSFTPRRVVHSLDGWEPSHQLRNASVMAGVQNFDHWIAKLRAGPIGGQRGVFADELDGYVESMFGKWRTWEETDRARDAQRAAAPAPSSRRSSSDVRAEPFEPAPYQEAFARRHGLDLSALLQGVLIDYPQPSGVLSRVDVLSERLTVAAKQKRAGAPVTGKLTREQAATWGPVPPGGAIPREEVA